MGPSLAYYTCYDSNRPNMSGQSGLGLKYNLENKKSGQFISKHQLGTAFGIAKGLVASFVSLTTNNTFLSDTELLLPYPTYSPSFSCPPWLHTPTVYFSFPYFSVKKHQMKLSSPVTTPDIYVNGAGIFQYQLCVLLEVNTFLRPLTRYKGNFGCSSWKKLLHFLRVLFQLVSKKTQKL